MTVQQSPPPTRPADDEWASSPYPGSVHLVTDLPSPRKAKLLRWVLSPVLVVVVLLAVVAIVVRPGREAAQPTTADATSTPTIESAVNPVDNIGTPAIALAADGETPGDGAVDPAAGASADDLSTGDASLPAAASDFADGVGGNREPGATQTPGSAVERTSRFVDGPTTRVLDTRLDDGAPLGPGESIVVDLAPHLAADATAVALSVGVAMAQGPGPITVALDRGPVTALTVGPPMNTNLVFVGRGSGNALTVSTVGGGHVVVDVVGSFEPSGPTASGRFVALGPQRIARLVTEMNGQEATVSPISALALPTADVGSVLVRIRADVGAEGGRVRMGPSADSLPNAMMWSPTADSDRARTGVAIVALDEFGEFALDYNGGAVLDVDLLGYFTTGLAEVSDAGLFVPIDPTIVFDGNVRSQSTSVAPVAALLDVPATVEAVALSVTGTASSTGDLVAFDRDGGLVRSATAVLGGGESRGGTALVPLDEQGLLSIFSEADAAVTVVATGYFRPASP